MRGTPLLALALLLVAGCVGQPEEAPAAPSPPPRVVFEEDGPPRGSAHLADGGHGGRDATCVGLGRWVQPGLASALLASDLTLHERAAAPGVARLEDGASVTHFGSSTRADGSRHSDSIFLWVAPESATQIAGMLAPERTREEARALFDAFAARVVVADADERDAMFDAFWATRAPGLMSYSPAEGERVEQYSHYVNVTAPLSVEDARRALGEPDETTRFVSTATLRWVDEAARSWEARLAYDELRADVEHEDGGVLVLRVAADDHVAAFSSASRGQPWIAEAMERAGLPRPDFAEWSTGLGVC